MPSFPWFRRRPSSRSYISTKEFASLLVARKTEILSAFVNAVTERIPAARNETRKFVEDHLASVIGELADFIASNGSEKDREQTKWLGNLHGKQRASNEKYTLEDIRTEYAILREVIFNEIGDERYLSNRASKLFNEIYANSFSHSTEHFLRNSLGELKENELREAEALKHVIAATGERDTARSEQVWFSDVLDRIPKPLFLLDAENRKAWFSNRAAKNMLGLDYEAIDPKSGDKSPLVVTTPDGVHVKPEDFPSQRAVRGETITGEEFIIFSPKGRFHVKVFAEQIPAFAGRKASALILLQDITALKQTEAAFLETEKQLRSSVVQLDRATKEFAEIIETTNDAFFSIDRNWNFTRLNANHVKITGRPKEEQLGRSLLDLYFPDPSYENSMYLKAYRKAMKERVPVVFEDYYEPLDLWSAVSVYPQSDGGLAVFFRRITEEKNTQKALVAAKEEAERANELKSAFLANMSHEIRTPLGAMLGFADLLREPGLTPTERASYIDILTRNGESLNVIINDVLDLSKVESGHLTVEYTDTYPDQIGAEVVSLLRVKAKEKDLVLEYSHDESSPSVVTTDPTRLRQILINLVGNAIKFTQFGSVKIRAYGCHTDDGRASICFEIKDTGIGISKDQHERIFEVFVQADGTMTRRFGGTGLGLALSRKLARQLGGDITVTESKEGFGTTFLLKIEDRPDKFDASATTRKKQGVPGIDAEQQVLKDVRILVVDDAPDNQQLIWRYLTKHGAHVESAENGLVGLRMAMNGTFDVILMDIQMPVMDGYTATAKLRERGFQKPIIALTAHAMTDVRKKALNVGYTDHLPKPIDARELVATIAKYYRERN